MKKSAKICKFIGMAWLYLAVGFIILNIVLIWYYSGFGRVQEVFNPFNFINLITVGLTLAPGLGLLYISEKLDK
jgi:putative exporter of polyketide antibiotics